MSRNRKSARQAGAKFEKLVADYLGHVVDDRIERRRAGGSRDRGDLTGLRAHGKRVVAEIKNTSRTDLAGWIKQAHLQAGNDDAACGIIIHKRHGTANPARQWVTMTLEDLAFLLTGEEQEGRYEP